MRLHKSTSLVGLLSLLPTISMGMASNFEGFYTGLNIGVMQTGAKIQNSSFATIEGGGEALAISEAANVYKNNVLGAFELGYGGFWDDRYYLGGEFFVNVARRAPGLSNNAYLDTGTIQSYLTAQTTAKTRNWEYGFDLRPGFLFDNHTIGYGRIGVAVNKLTLSSAGDYVTNTTALGTYDSPYVTGGKKNLAALRLGLGVERMVNQCLGLTVDYIYTYYGNVSGSSAANTTYLAQGPVTLANGIENSASSKVGTQAIMLGFRYYFDMTFPKWF